jgi:hypothetical protein
MAGRAGLAGLIVLVALAAAGCGGGAKAPSVASLGGSGAGTDAAGGTAAGGPPTGGSLVLNSKNGLQFAQCMRAHGVENFPDPNSKGEIQIGPSSGIDPRSRTFRAAQQACQKVLPNGGRPTPTQLAKMRRGALAFSACMRAHGVPNFPDPIFSSGKIELRIGAGPGSDIDPSSPTFQSAQRKCQGHLDLGAKSPAGGG